ncbi:MAG TPA: carboxypeptidase-like regulatory domain-containing protein [Rhodocyclaceae bacterium]
MKATSRRTPGATALRGVMLCASLGAAASAYALAAPDLPPEQHQGAVSFRTGGIGEDESKAMQQAAHQYPLELEFVSRSGDSAGGYLADVDVAIRDAHGSPVLQTRADGPFLLAKLPPGRYTVTAQYQASQLSRRVEIPAHGAQHVLFGW